MRVGFGYGTAAPDSGVLGAAAVLVASDTVFVPGGGPLTGTSGPAYMFALNGATGQVVWQYGTTDTAIEAMKLGAADYIMKPFPNAEIRMLVGRAIEQRNLADYLIKALSPDAPYLLSDGGVIATGYDEELDRLRLPGQ